MAIPQPETDRVAHALADVGLVIGAVGEELHGTAEVLPTMWVPGTSALRVSMLATWADTMLGLLAVRALAPRVPVTLELDIHLFADIEGTPEVRSVARLTRAGRAVLVLSIDFLVDDERVGFGHALFMAAPDPSLTIPMGNWALDGFAARRGTLVVPFADRVGCERTGPASAILPCADHVLNQSKGINGGLLTVAIEEAALSADPAGRPIRSMQVRYLRAIRTGPAVARATVTDGLGEVEVHDGASGALAVLATTITARTHRN
jgi:acyl-coenzyme A thioesterase PaaI-like protein